MENISERKSKIHYAWLILLACCLIQGAGLGVVNNCVGLYYIPICQDLEVARGDIALYATFRSLSCCAGMLLAPKILHKINIRYILSVASLLAGVPFFFLAQATEIWHWYLWGSIQGLGTAFTTTLIVPIVLRNWFYKRLGFAIGTSTAFAGIVSAIMSLIISAAIRGASWRFAYFLSACIVLIMALPPSLLIMRMTPEEKDLQPYGAVGLQKASAPEPEIATDSDGKTSIWSVGEMIVLGMLAKIFCSFGTHLTAYGASVPITVVDAAMLTTLSLMGNMLTKLLFGPVNDKFGAGNASKLAIFAVSLSILLLISQNQLGMCVGAFLFGTTAMFSTTEVPLIARAIWDKHKYTSTMVAVNVAANLAAAFATPLFGYLYDWFQNYQIVFLILALMLAAEWMLVCLLIRKK